jgi:type II restriction enzyme
LAIQIKHLSLSEELAENIVSSVTADRIVIICKSAEQKVIVSLLNQIGWKSRIQAIVTETDLLNWYEKALRGTHGNALGKKILETLNSEIQVEFPATENQMFENFYKSRDYDKLNDEFWATI